MSVSLIGALIGLVIGVADFLVLRLVADRVEMPETKRVLTLAGLAQVVILPVAGWLLAPMLFGGE